jgi:hypothetical protein
MPLSERCAFSHVTKDIETNEKPLALPETSVPAKFSRAAAQGMAKWGGQTNQRSKIAQTAAL